MDLRDYQVEETPEGWTKIWEHNGAIAILGEPLRSVESNGTTILILSIRFSATASKESLEACLDGAIKSIIESYQRMQEIQTSFLN